MQRSVVQFMVSILVCILVFPTLLYAAGSWQGKVVSVTDGDTIKVLKDDKQVKIRLAAIDCPEKGQPYGQAAKKLTAALVAGKIVKVWPTDTDRYGSTIAFIFVGAVSRSGMARSVKCGLWSEPVPVLP